MAALNEQREQALVLLAEMGVDAKAASELAARITAHARKELSAEDWDAQAAASHEELSRAWGKDFKRNMYMAREVALRAIEKAP